MEDVSENGELLTKNTVRRGKLGSGYTQFAEGDVLVAKITPCFENGKGALALGLTNKIGFGTTEFHVIRPLDPADADYLHQVTLSRGFRNAGERQMQAVLGKGVSHRNLLKISQFTSWRTMLATLPVGSLLMRTLNCLS